MALAPEGKAAAARREIRELSRFRRLLTRYPGDPGDCRGAGPMAAVRGPAVALQCSRSAVWKLKATYCFHFHPVRFNFQRVTGLAPCSRSADQCSRPSVTAHGYGPLGMGFPEKARVCDMSYTCPDLYVLLYVRGPRPCLLHCYIRP